MVETETYTVEGPDGDADEFELPAGLVDVLAEQGEQPSTVAADIAFMGFVERAHGIVHHSEGQTPEDLREMSEAAEDLFEKRFGISFAEAMGHDH